MVDHISASAAYTDRLDLCTVGRGRRLYYLYLKITELVYLLCIKLKIPEDKQSLILSGKLSGKALINLLHPPEGVK